MLNSCSARAVITVFCGLASMFATADVKVTSHMHVDANGNTTPDQAITVFYKGPMIRYEAASTVTIIDTTTGMTTMLRPDNKTYTQFNANKMGESNPALAGMTIQAKATVTSTNLHKQIAGKNATKFVADIDMVMSDKSQPKYGQHTTMHMVKWTTADVPLQIPPEVLAKFSSQQAAFLGLPGMDNVTKELSKIVGLPLSSEVTITTEVTGPPGEALPPKATEDINTDVDSITEGPLDDALFQIPAGFKQIGS